MDEENVSDNYIHDTLVRGSASSGKYPSTKK